jgi:hypothetical protein
MKKLDIIIGVFAIGILIFLTSCVIIPMVGNGNIVESERTVSSFEKIDSGGSAEVRFHLSQEYRVVVTTDSNLQKIVKINTRNNVLSIGTKNGHSYSFTKWIVDVYCPTLTGISISGSGSFRSTDKITVSTFELTVSGSGKIDGPIECEAFSATISGSGKINLSGNSKESNITISGSGELNANNFIVKNSTILVTGSGEGNIYVTKYFKANISGSGTINYRGNPQQVESNITGSGKLNKL